MQNYTQVYGDSEKVDSLFARYCTLKLGLVSCVKGHNHHLLFLLRLGVHIDVHIPGSVQLLKFLKLVLLSQCLTFYQHNNTSKEREDNY